MATGDDAVAGGMSVVLGTELANTLDTIITATRDYIANGPTHWKPGVVLPLERLAAQPVRDEAAGNTLGLDWVGSRMVMKVDGTNQGEIAKKSEIDQLTASVNDRLWLGGGTVSGNVSILGQLFLPNSSIATSGWTAAFINSDGRVTRGASSSRYKKDIVRDCTLPDVFAVPISSYKMRADADAKTRYGYIAEDLDKHEGTREFVTYDEEGRPETYDMIGLLLAQVAQLRREIQELRDAGTD